MIEIPGMMNREDRAEFFRRYEPLVARGEASLVRPPACTLAPLGSQFWRQKTGHFVSQWLDG
jgi:hypothetical protein